MSQIAAEAGVSAPNEDLNNSSIRTLAGVTGDRTTIAFSQLRGKSSFSGQLCTFTGSQYGYTTYTGSTIATGARFVSVVLVGGGGGGGSSGPRFGDGGGGGGAGGVAISPKMAVTPGAPFSFSIGQGGSGACGGGRGSNGGCTSLTINNITYTVPGGGGGGGARGGSHQQKALNGANGGGSNGTNVTEDSCSGALVYPPGAACCVPTDSYIPGGAGQSISITNWTYYGGNAGGAALNNGLNGGGGGALRSGANAFNVTPTGGPGVTPVIAGYPGTLPGLAAGGGAGGDYTNNQNADVNCIFSTLLPGCYNHVVTSNLLAAAPGGGGQGGIGVDANGSQINTPGTPGTAPGAGGGGGGGTNPQGGAGADGIIYAWFTSS